MGVTTANQCKESTGKFQSPINIVTSNVRYQEFRPISLSGHSHLSIERGTLYAKNTGNTLKMYVTNNHTLALVEGGPLTVPYKFLEMHFHWGDRLSGNTGSEHTVDGYQYPLEVHMVHKNIMDDTVDEALQHSNGITVLAFKFEVTQKDTNTKDNHGMENLANIAKKFLVKPKSKFDKKKMKKMNWFGDVNVVNFLPVYMDEYFSYRGSLTTGGCEEAVNWIVFKDPLAITSEQLHSFQHLTREDGSQILNNFRETQPVNDRSVYYHGVDLILSNTITRGSSELLRDITLPQDSFALPFMSCKDNPSPAPSAVLVKEKMARQFWNTKTCTSGSLSLCVSSLVILCITLEFLIL